MPAAAIAQPNIPMRHIRHDTAKGLKVPWATGLAEAFDEGDRKQGTQHTDKKTDSFCFSQGFEGAPRSPDAREQGQKKDPSQVAAALVHDLDHPPILTQRKACRVAPQSGHFEVTPRKVPSEQKQHGNDADESGSSPQRCRFRGCHVGRVDEHGLNDSRTGQETQFFQTRLLK